MTSSKHEMIEILALHQATRSGRCRCGHSEGLEGLMRPTERMARIAAHQAEALEAAGIHAFRVPSGA